MIPNRPLEYFIYLDHFLTDPYGALDTDIDSAIEHTPLLDRLKKEIVDIAIIRKGYFKKKKWYPVYQVCFRFPLTPADRYIIYEMYREHIVIPHNISI